MFIVWGTRRYQKDIGKSFISKECDNCHNEVTLIIKMIQTKFTIFWIPLFTTSTKYYLVCPICNQGMEISKQEAEEYAVDESTT
ncbi:MAG: zinc-ribbon domain-containing protein [Coprobacillaceae bacterium]